MSIAQHYDTPTGWYTDPENPAQQRWWTGSAWTANVRLRGEAHARAVYAVARPATTLSAPVPSRRELRENGALSSRSPSATLSYHPTWFSGDTTDADASEAALPSSEDIAAALIEAFPYEPLADSGRAGSERHRVHRASSARPARVVWTATGLVAAVVATAALIATAAGIL